jgi:hypothetical protein
MLNRTLVLASGPELLSQLVARLFMSLAEPAGMRDQGWLARDGLQQQDAFVRVL